MGGIIKPRQKGPSAEQRKLQKEQAALARKQQEQLEAQKAQLAEDEAQAQLEADRARNERIKGQKAIRSRNRGRASLIKTGTELGTSGLLG